DDPRRDLVRLANPLSAEEPALSPTLLVGLLRAASLNIGRGHETVQISEIGRVFRPRAERREAPIYGVDRRPTEEELAALDAALPEQPRHVGFVLVGERQRSGWNAPGRPVSWTDAKAVAQRLADTLHVELQIAPGSLAPFHPGRCARLTLDGEVVGHVGELHPKVAEEYGLPGRVAAGELDLDALIAAAPAIGPKPDFSAFPVAKEDFAFVVDESLPAGELEAAIRG